MDLSSIISADHVFVDMKANSKKQLLQELATLTADKTELDERTVFETLLQREKLGSTGVGGGVAIPHGKLPGISGIVGLFGRLHKPIEYDAMDELPVDIVFMLIAPEGAGADHLKALSRIARILRQDSTLAQLRTAEDADAVFSLLTDVENANAA